MFFLASRDKSKAELVGSLQRIAELEAVVDRLQNHVTRVSHPTSHLPMEQPTPIVDNGVFDFDPATAMDGETLLPEDCSDDSPLPPIEEGFELLQHFFQHFNQVIPLFDPPSFMHLTRRHYKNEHHNAPAWWAAVNIALALAYRLDALRMRNPQEEKKALPHLHNALESVNTLILSKPEILSIQALLGMVIFLQGTPNPHPAPTLIATAVRLCQNLGLHQHQPRIQSYNNEQRKRTFWLAYQLDKDCSVRLHQPFAQNDDDIDVELLNENPDDGIGVILAVDGTSFNFFSHCVELFTILGRIYSKLQSVQALKKSSREISDDAQALDRSLGDWTSRIPCAFRPEKMTTNLPRFALLHMVILYLSYFNCLSKLHSVTLPDTSSITLSSGNYVRAARAALHLVNLIPQGDYACTW